MIMKKVPKVIYEKYLFCEICGGMMYFDGRKLMSDPPISIYKCNSCGKEDYGNNIKHESDGDVE